MVSQAFANSANFPLCKCRRNFRCSSAAIKKQLTPVSTEESILMNLWSMSIRGNSEQAKKFLKSAKVRQLLFSVKKTIFTEFFRHLKKCKYCFVCKCKLCYQAFFSVTHTTHQELINYWNVFEKLIFKNTTDGEKRASKLWLPLRKKYVPTRLTGQRIVWVPQYKKTGGRTSRDCVEPVFSKKKFGQILFWMKQCKGCITRTYWVNKAISPNRVPSLFTQLLLSCGLAVEKLRKVDMLISVAMFSLH